jgi:hypothetical protein
MKNPDLYTKDYTHFINYSIDKPFVSCPNAEYNYTTFGFMYAAYIFELLSKKKYMEHYDDSLVSIMTINHSFLIGKLISIYIPIGVKGIN